MVRVACELVAAARKGVDETYGALDRAVRAHAQHADAVTVWELTGDQFVCRFAGGERYEHYGDASVSALAPGSPLAETRRTAREVVLRDGLVPLHPGDRAAVAVPLGELPLIAYVALANPPRKDELRDILDVSAIAAAALAIARDRAEDRTRATYDGLTGLLTPRAFRSELTRQLREAPRVRLVPRLALSFVDTDRFKEWNDRYGHAAGDELLRKLAAMLRAHATGPEDLVARNGGDEFCLVWADCEKSSAIRRAQALCNAIAVAFAGDAVAITASIGVAAFPLDAQTAEGLLEAADAAMYEAKRSGRNRVSYA